MSDNFADKYFKADVCSSAGLRALPIVHFCQNLNEHEPNIVTNLTFYDLLTTLSVGLVMSE